MLGWSEFWSVQKYFLKNQPLQAIIGGYSMAARSPLFNSFEAACMSLLGNKESRCCQPIISIITAWHVILFWLSMRQLCGALNGLSPAFAALNGIASVDISWSIIYP
jgi:hypothetical protein